MRERSDDEIELARRALDEFRSLHARKIIEDELFWRSCGSATRTTSRAGSGAEAIRR